MKKIVATLQKESGSFQYKAKIFSQDNGFVIEYIGPGNKVISVDNLNTPDLNEARQFAQTWLDGIQNLNG